MPLGEAPPHHSPGRRVLSALPVIVHLEMSTALVVLGLIALWLWRDRH
jgi:hypothetical protein